MANWTIYARNLPMLLATFLIKLTLIITLSTFLNGCQGGTGGSNLSIEEITVYLNEDSRVSTLWFNREPYERIG